MLNQLTFHYMYFLNEIYDFILLIVRVMFVIQISLFLHKKHLIVPTARICSHLPQFWFYIFFSFLKLECEASP